MIKVLAPYNTTDNIENRAIFPAACNKLSYIIDRLSQDQQVEVISASNTLNKKSDSATVKQLNENATLQLLKGSGRGKSRLAGKISTILFKMRLFFHLLFHVKKDDDLWVYHSLSYMGMVKFVKKIKKCRLILEVEEIYGDVIKSSKTVKKELKYFKKADAYIFPTQLLHEKINGKGKPYAIIHGTYNVEEQRADKFDDGRIHCVYAGTFDPRKGGVAAAAAAAQFLDEKYHLHIIGFGSENDTKLLINTIQEMSKKTRCKITYDGLLSGEEYIRFLQSCDIGLSTQNPSAAFNDTSFPSKVLSYMANGLRVVSVKIKALETSAVNNLLYYYEGDQPERIAEAIRSIDMNDGYDSRKCIRELDENFCNDLRKLWEK